MQKLPVQNFCSTTNGFLQIYYTWEKITCKAVKFEFVQRLDYPNIASIAPADYFCRSFQILDTCLEARWILFADYHNVRATTSIFFLRNRVPEDTQRLKSVALWIVFLIVTHLTRSENIEWYLKLTEEYCGCINIYIFYRAGLYSIADVSSGQRWVLAITK